MKRSDANSAYSLRIVADLKELAGLRAFVEEKAAALGLDSSAVYDLLIAVNEIATNIIVHGYQGQAGEIAIELRRTGDRIEVDVRDRAPLFDPTLVPTPDISVPLERRQPGGMGIHLTRQLTDAMIYRVIAPGCNEVTLVKHVHPTNSDRGA